MTTELILLNVELDIGTEAHTRKATTTLFKNIKGEDIGGVDGANEPVDGGIVLMDGCAAAGSPLRCAIGASKSKGNHHTRVEGDIWIFGEQ